MLDVECSMFNVPDRAILSRLWAVCNYLTCLVLAGCVTDRDDRIATDSTRSTPEQRAVTYLAREVPLWLKENKCFSCHNNGDAARALYVASRQSYPVPKNSLEDTTAWLVQPDQWEHNKGDPGFSDKRLARIQFAAALVTAVETGHLANSRALARAAALIAELQDADGAWRIGADELVGSPATYGTYLATGMALRTLRAARSERHRNAIEKAERWLRQAPVRNVIEAAAVLLASQKSNDAEARVRQPECRNLIGRGQSEDGGWGPHVYSAPESFDTALVLLALAGLPSDDEIADRIRRGRKFLLAMQQADGSWPETTRPSGAESYAQRISTTGWAALALLATGPRGREEH
jgi:hypothetical protein